VEKKLYTLDKVDDILSILTGLFEFQTELFFNQGILEVSEETKSIIVQFSATKKRLEISPFEKDDIFQVDYDQDVLLRNRKKNISFKSKILSFRGSRSLILSIPKTIVFENLRDFPRSYIPFKTPLNGRIKNITNPKYHNSQSIQKTKILDYSENGFGLKVDANLDDKILLNDKVEISLGEDGTDEFLLNYGHIRSKAIALPIGPQESFLRLGIELERKISLRSVQRLI
jgi:hypothetical protein